jgi:zinc protease
MGKCKLLFLIMVLVLHFSQLPAAETKKSDGGYQLPAGISVHTLGNGLQVLLIENPLLPMTGLNVAVKIGSAYENFATSGMSHMLEHLLFNGTEQRSQKQLYDEVDLIGGYNNANTSYYYTNYMMVIPADKARQGMELQADMLFHSVLPADKFEKEKGIILEEIAKDLDDPKTAAENNVHAILFQNHALSLPVAGTYTTIESLSRDDVYAFYKNAYRPNNMILTAIGPFNTDSMLVLLAGIYGTAKPGNVDYPRYTNWNTGTEAAAPVTERINVFHRYYRGEELLLQMFFELPVQFSQVQLALLDEILAKHHDRIFAELQKKYPGTIVSLDFGNLHFPVKNYLTATITVSSEQYLQNIAEYVQHDLSDLKLILPPETADYLAARAHTDYLLNLEKPHMFGIYNAETLVLSGIETIFQEIALSSFLAAEQQLRSYRIDSRPVIVVQHPESRKTLRPGETSLQTKVFVDSTSGAVLIARQNPASDLLAVHYLFKHKAKYESQFGKNAAQILHDCLGQRLSSTANQKISNRYGLNFKVNDDPAIPMDDIYLHPDFGYIRAEGLAAADDLSGVISYLSTQLNTFVPTVGEFTKAVAKTKHPGGGGMTGSKTNELFTRSYTNAVYEANAFPDIINEISYDDLLKFKEVYLTPANVIISVVSPATPDSLYRLFRKNMPVTKKEGIDRQPAYQRALKLLTAEFNNDFQGSAEQSYLFWGFTAEILPADRPALEVFSQILADRIIFNVREKQGRAYRMNTGIEVVNDKALFYFRLGTRPANIDALLPQLPAFFDPAMVNSITAAELEKTLNQYLGRMMFRRLSSINQAYYLAYSLYFYGNSEFDQQLLKQIKQVTLEDIKRVAGKYMVVRNPVTVIMR